MMIWGDAHKQTCKQSSDKASKQIKHGNNQARDQAPNNTSNHHRNKITLKYITQKNNQASKKASKPSTNHLAAQ
jgi:hypothetical protein